MALSSKTIISAVILDDFKARQASKKVETRPDEIPGAYEEIPHDR